MAEAWERKNPRGEVRGARALGWVQIPGVFKWPLPVHAGGTRNGHVSPELLACGGRRLGRRHPPDRDGAATVEKPGDGPQSPNGTVSSVSLVWTTNTARSLAGVVLLALALTRWRSPGSSEKLCPGLVGRHLTVVDLSIRA